MNEFLLVFRNDVALSQTQMSPDQMQTMMKTWMDWIGGIAAQNKLASPGNRLGPTGKVLAANSVVTDGPFVEIKEAIGGYIIVKAETIEEATQLSEGCPIIDVGGTVEIRMIIKMN
jgi:hypothetical protein